MYSVLILMSTYNGEKYLRDQLDSIRKQTIYDNIKIFVRDDGSTDGTIDILNEYSKDRHLEYIVGKNIGSANSFYELLKLANNADFYAFADQDDVWLPEKIERAVNCLAEKRGPALYGCAKKIVDENLIKMNMCDLYPAEGILNTMLKTNVVYGCTMVFNHKLREKYLIHSHSVGKLYHDSYLWKLASILGEVIFDKKEYILYRQHSENTVGALKGGVKLFAQRLERLIIEKKYRDDKTISNISRIWCEIYRQDIPENKYDLLKKLANVNSSYKARIKLLLEPGLDMFPLYEYVGYKLRIILGWL